MVALVVLDGGREGSNNGLSLSRVVHLIPRNMTKVPLILAQVNGRAIFETEPLFNADCCGKTQLGAEVTSPCLSLFGLTFFVGPGVFPL